MAFINDFPLIINIKGSISASDGKSLNLFDYMENKDNNSLPTKFYKYSDSVDLSQNQYNESSSISNNDDSPLDKGILFCDKCKGPYRITFLDNLDLSYECGCHSFKNITIQEYKNSYQNDQLIKGKNNNDYSLHCEKHPKETKFEYFCDYCKYDVCKECLEEDSNLYFNTVKKYKTHENHGLIKLDIITQKFPYMEKLIQDFKDLEEKSIYSKKKKKKIKDIISVIKTIIKYYKEYKCYNFYVNIQNAEIFLKKIKDNFIFGEHENIISFHKISKINNLNKIKEFSDIISISIERYKSPISLSIFKDKKFLHLKEFILKEVEIKDIESLSSCEFPVLEKLSLEKAGIDNKIINILKNKELPKITYISLYVNKITELEIFNAIKKFTTLASFHIGENKFDYKPNNKSIYKLPKSLTELGLTGNFDGKNNDFIKQLDISNLKTFYFSRNNLKDLKYLENIEFTQLNKLWVISNQITDIKEIKNISNKKNLKILNIKDNKINNFNELINIIKDFIDLEYITVSLNGITKEEVEEMKKNIKESYNRNVNIYIDK